MRGDVYARTPHLDALARAGMRFDHAYWAYPVCMPSRAALLTGKFAHTYGVYNNATPWPFAVKTVADYFGRHGYMTGLIGKMHFVDAQTQGLTTGWTSTTGGSNWDRKLGCIPMSWRRRIQGRAYRGFRRCGRTMGTRGWEREGRMRGKRLCMSGERRCWRSKITLRVLWA